MAETAKPFEIGHRSIAPGTRTVVELPVSVLSNHMPVVMSVLVIHGRRPGPVVFVSAALHGDEILGVEIIRRLVTSSALKGLRGTLIAVPIVNAFGFIGLSRYLPDRRDLNRSFPGSRVGSLAAQLADLFMREVVARSDFGIDLHTGAVHRANLPQVRVASLDPKLARLAENFGAPVILRGRAPDGSLRAAANAIGKHVLLYEAGEALRFDEVAIRVGLRGVLSVLHGEQMITRRAQRTSKVAPIWLDRSQWVRAPQGGIVRAMRAIGDAVETGEPLAALADPFGQSEEQVVSPLDGIIIGHSNLPVTNRGDPLFHIAETSSDAAAETVQIIEDLVDQDPALADEPVL